MSIDFKTHVLDTYSQIATAFDKTRYIVWDKVKEYLDSLSPDTYMLDAGCGNGKNMLYRKDIHSIGVDTCSEFIEICHNKGLMAVSGNITNLPFVNETFDSVISIAVIHHIPEPEGRLAAIREIVRVLKPGGTAFISVWSISVLDTNKSLGKFTLIKDQDYLVKWKNLQDRYYHLFSDDIRELVAECQDHTIDKDRDNYTILIKKPRIFTQRTFDSACESGLYKEIVSTPLNLIRELCYNKTVDLVVQSNNLNLLAWMKSNTSFIYTEETIIIACQNKNISILNWFLQTFNENLKISQLTLYNLCRSNNYEIFDWYIKNNLMKSNYYSSHLLSVACKYQSVEVLNLLYLENQELFISSYSDDTFIDSLHSSHIKVLDWFINNNLGIKYDTYDLALTCMSDTPAILEYLLYNNNLKHSAFTITFAAKGNNVEVLAWFLENIVNGNLVIDYKIVIDQQWSEKVINIVTMINKN
jgi:SAM-dependent methyltransferase